MKNKLALLGLIFSFNIFAELRATDNLGLIIERAEGSVQIIEHSHHISLAKITNLGDLFYASVVFFRDQRYVYIFRHDGGLIKIDLLNDEITQITSAILASPINI